MYVTETNGCQATHGLVRKGQWGSGQMITGSISITASLCTVSVHLGARAQTLITNSRFLINHISPTIAPNSDLQFTPAINSISHDA